MSKQNEYLQIGTACGPVRGKRWKEGGIFLGIPYGRAERFRAPEEVRWEEPLDCLEYGPIAPQPLRRGERPSASPLPFDMAGSEDGCLNLNVWSPRTEAGAKLPVVVYVHGGAFQYGCNSKPDCAGDRFMGEEEMVYISVNYRLGVMGFLELGKACGADYAGSGNCAAQDLLLALKWVQHSCACFGGDPERIILMGISAGAKAIGSLLTLPEVQALCHRVILESGAMQSFRTVETAEAVTERFLKYLPEGMDVRTAPAEEVLKAQAEFCACDGNTCFFGPVLTAPFRADWMERWEQGERFSGKAVIGGGRHELIRQAKKSAAEGRLEETADELFGKNGALARQLARERAEKGMDPVEAWEPVYSDFMYRFYSNALARKLEADGSEVWCYSFDYKEAGHGMGFFFLMGKIDPPEGPLTGAEAEEARRVSDSLREKVLAWIREDGAPEAVWPRYRGGNKLVVDAGTRMEYRPADAQEGFPAQVYCL